MEATTFRKVRSWPVLASGWVPSSIPFSHFECPGLLGGQPGGGHPVPQGAVLDSGWLHVLVLHFECSGLLGGRPGGGHHIPQGEKYRGALRAHAASRLQYRCSAEPGDHMAGWVVLPDACLHTPWSPGSRTPGAAGAFQQGTFSRGPFRSRTLARASFAFCARAFPHAAQLQVPTGRGRGSKSRVAWDPLHAPCALLLAPASVAGAPHAVWGSFRSSPQVQTDRGTGSESERVKLKLMVRVEAVEYDAEGELR